MIARKHFKYQAISSTTGKIMQILIAYNGSRKSFEFIADAINKYPEEIKLIIWVRSPQKAQQLYKYIQKSGRKNCTVLPEQKQSHISGLICDNTLKQERIWLRDAYWIGVQNERWSVFASRYYAIPEYLKSQGIISDYIFRDWLPDFGNILYDRKFLFIGYEDLMSLPIPKQYGLSKEQFLLNFLFPNQIQKPKIVKVGFQHEELKGISLDKSTMNLFRYFSHTDLFLCPMGVDLNMRQVVMVPKLESPHVQLKRFVRQGNFFMHHITNQLNDEGIEVIRNPIPVILTSSGQIWIGYYNNAIVEVTNLRRRVWLPQFNFPGKLASYFDSIVSRNKAIWEDFNFDVTFLAGGMRKLSKGGDRAGALRCLTIDFRK